MILSQQEGLRFTSCATEHWYHEDTPENTGLLVYFVHSVSWTSAVVIFKVSFWYILIWSTWYFWWIPSSLTLWKGFLHLHIVLSYHLRDWRWLMYFFFFLSSNSLIWNWNWNTNLLRQAVFYHVFRANNTTPLMTAHSWNEFWIYKCQLHHKPFFDSRIFSVLFCLVYWLNFDIFIKYNISG